jgi:hypothetical protein
MAVLKSDVLGSTPHFRANVTKDIVDRGIARNSNHCMIAEAVKEAYPRLSRIAVDIQTIRATDQKKGERYVWLTPRSTQRAIIDFDQGKKPQPFTFGLTNGQTLRVRKYPEATKKKMRKYYHDEIKPKKQAEAKIRRRGGTNVPNVIGGTAPPKSVGARRSFGLRSLQV